MQHSFLPLNWGRASAIVTIALAVWRIIAWVLGLAWGRYVQKAMAPEFEQLRKEIRRDRRLRRIEYQALTERIARLEGERNVPKP